MTDFLIKSTSSLTVLLGFYHLILEREKIHQFNRFYLLFAVVISFVIPFLNFEIIKIVPVVQNIQPLTSEINSSGLPESEQQEIIVSTVENTNYTTLILWSLYGVISTLFLIRFGKNIWKLISKSKSNPIVKYNNANLVLVEEKTLPHTFLNSIFINYEDYNSRNIEDELYSHELVHVTQKHTLDILFIEFLRVIFWFNPLLMLYKKAIQLNHEFLADEEIVKTYKNVPFYQNLLLQKGSETQTIYLASNLNYLITKKRLIMMTKTTSQKIALLKKISVIPVLTGLIYFFCIEIVAQEKILGNSKKIKPQKIVIEKINDTIKKKTKNDSYKTISNVNPQFLLSKKKGKSGYVFYNNQTYFYVENESKKIEYYNRWGVLINNKKITTELAKSQQFTTIEEANQSNENNPKANIKLEENEFNISNNKAPMKKENGKFYENNIEINILDKLSNQGYLYKNNQTFYYIKEDNKITVYDRWGNLDRTETQFFN